MGTDQSFRMALDDSTLVPVGGVAARLKRVSEATFAVDHPDVKSESYGMVFCFLPLPIKYPFPVHINGYFAVHSSRLSLYEPMALDRGDKRAAWNVALIDDAVSTAYCNLLQDLTELCPTEASYAAWPSVKALKEAGCLAARLYQSLYRRICTGVDLKVVKVDDGWTHFDSCLMLSPAFKQDTISQTAMKVLPRVIGKDKKAVDIPARIINIMLQTEVARKTEEKLIDKATFYEKLFYQTSNLSIRLTETNWWCTVCSTTKYSCI
jgi:hypothetical protein